jgi:hypothetical protein
VLASLNGERSPGRRSRSAPDPFAAYVDYTRIRLADDRDLWAEILAPATAPGSCRC